MTEQFNVPQRRSVRIYNPIDIDLVRELGKSGENPYTGAGPQLVAAGPLSNEKGFDLVLAAMPRVIECLPSVRLTILGHGPLSSALAEQVERLGLTESVNFLGFRRGRTNPKASLNGLLNFRCRESWVNTAHYFLVELVPRICRAKRPQAFRSYLQ
jgi:glycosyltransferase involved in cell wall biosynthesis